MLQKGSFLSSFTAKGQIAEGVFCISNAQKCNSRNGRPFWSMTLSDSSASLPAKIWPKGTWLVPESLPNSGLVQVEGMVDAYNGTIQIIVDKIEVLDEKAASELDPGDFSKDSAFDADALFDELMERARGEFRYGPWKKLVETYFADAGRLAKFKRSSAAKSIHHAGRGGLVAHTLEVFKICQGYADVFPDLDRQTLLAGALFHDIGKTVEMSTDLFGVSYTAEGSLVGHIFLGLQLLAPLCKEVGLPEPLRLHFFHLISSHHGRLEFGSPKEPASREAFALHFADMVDARLTLLSKCVESVDPGSFSTSTRELGYAVYNPVSTASFMDASEQGAAEPPSKAPAEAPAASALATQQSSPSSNAAAKGAADTASPAASQAAPSSTASSSSSPLPQASSRSRSAAQAGQSGFGSERGVPSDGRGAPSRKHGGGEEPDFEWGREEDDAYLSSYFEEEAEIRDADSYYDYGRGQQDARTPSSGSGYALQKNAAAGGYASAQGAGGYASSQASSAGGYVSAQGAGAGGYASTQASSPGGYASTQASSPGGYVSAQGAGSGFHASAQLPSAGGYVPAQGAGAGSHASAQVSNTGGYVPSQTGGGASARGAAQGQKQQPKPSQGSLWDWQDQKKYRG